MIPKFRAWFSEASQMITDGLESINFFNETVTITSVYGHSVRSIEVDIGNAILMQYTGCRDKNGTEIYEGDVVKVGTLDGEPIGYIEWRANMACYRVTNHINPFGGEVVSEYHTKDFEVIGNIYEHPELLEAVE